MNKTYILKSVNEYLTAYNGFKWQMGIVEAPDFKPTNECGHGLHGFLLGEGDGNLANWDVKAKWIVAEVDKDDVIDLEGKVKFPKCKVIFIGDRKEATDLIISKGGKAVIGSFVTSGDWGTSNSGDSGTSTSGDSGTSTSGDSGTSTSGDYGTSTSGYMGTSTSGNYGTSTSGYRGTSTSGDRGTSTSGYMGTSTSGDSGTSTSGDRGTSTSGDSGTSTSGDSGTSTSGDKGTSTSGDWGTSTSGNYGTSTSGYSGTSISGDMGTLVIKYLDKNTGRYKLSTAYVGEDGILPNTPYILNDKGDFIKK